MTDDSRLAALRGLAAERRRTMPTHDDNLDDVEERAPDGLRALQAQSMANREEVEAVKVYVAMICDRHAEPEPFVFTSPERAVEFAKGWAAEHARRPEDVEEEPVEGWLYHARYSPESDSVWVLERDLDDGPT